MKTLVIGASENPDRYSNKAAKMLLNHGHQVVLYGRRVGEIEGNPIITNFPSDDDIDTVTMYVGPVHQPDLYESIESLSPRRVIFNPGTENKEFQERLDSKGIAHEDACTLVLLSTGQF